MGLQLVAVGTSLGGFDALAALLGGLPTDFPLPVAVVQHRSREQSEVLTSLLSDYTELPVIEVEDKEEIRGQHVYLCPANYHLLVDGGRFSLSADAPVISARPSIDVLFESAAESLGAGVVGVLLTGMSRDGTAGLSRIKQCGGIAIVQDPETAEGQTMPRAAISSVRVDNVLPLREIAPFLVELWAKQQNTAAAHDERRTVIDRRFAEDRYE